MSYSNPMHHSNPVPVPVPKQLYYYVVMPAFELLTCNREQYLRKVAGLKETLLTNPDLNYLYGVAATAQVRKENILEFYQEQASVSGETK